MKNGGSTKKDNWLRRRNPIERIFHDREQESSSSAVIVIFFFFFFGSRDRVRGSGVDGNNTQHRYLWTEGGCWR